MGGSGSGPIRPTRSPDQVRRELEKAERAALEAGFKTKLSAMLNDLLSEFNDRNRDLINDRIDELKDFVGDDLEASVSSLFGGSVAKHTFVNGLSDVDTLFVLKKGDIAGDAPDELLNKFGDLIKNKLGNAADVSVGKMAVTIDYPDGMELQVLPAITTEGSGKIQVAANDGKKWSRIDPQKFQEALTRRNEECGGKLVPTIKLAKAINGTLPEPLQLSGYHLESIAVNAFRNYDGPTTPADMLRNFYSKGSELVLAPITDKTGQSVHVDEYLGEPGSRERRMCAAVMSRIEKRMINATSVSSLDAWQSIFGVTP